MYDIGASTGNIGNAISNTLESRSARLVAIDNAESMRPLYKGPGEFVVCPAEEFDYQPFDVAILFLTMMFVRPAMRGQLIQRLRKNLTPGGAILIFDKSVPGPGYVATVLSRLALAGKVAAGVKSSEIVAKEMSLAGVQRPIDFSEIEPCTELFRFGDFAGFIIEG